jgi:hypothetical protein
MTPLEQARIDAAEEEFGEPFADILSGFAADGCNLSVTAGALGIPYESFRKMLKQMAGKGITIGWPCPFTSRQKTEFVMTERRLESSRESIKKAHAASMDRWRSMPLGTREGFEVLVKLRNDQRLTWASIAARAGVDLSTVMRARKRYGVPDPLGKTLQINARKLINELNAQKKSAG